MRVPILRLNDRVLIVAIGAQNAFVLRQGLQRQHVGHVLVGPHHHLATAVLVDDAHRIDFEPALVVDAEHLLVVA
mgnify:CR=1 FL=1